MSRIESLYGDQLALGVLGRRLTRYAALSALAGWIATAAVAALGDRGLERFFRAYLTNFMFVLGLGLGALFFLLVTHLTRAAWSVALRRIVEAVALTLPLAAGLVVGVVLGRHELYEWTHAEVVAADELLAHKSAYLNTPFFLVRLVIYFAVWSALALYFARASARQDASGDPAATLRMERRAAPGMISYAVTVTFASFDLLMSLYPHWYSTIYGVYFFSGSLLASFALVTLLVLALRRAGKLANVVTPEHFHDLGKLMFAFTVFWAYIGFSQYMLIWYAHLPEETVWFLTRQHGPWAGFSLFLLFGHFIVPFFWLLSRHAKRRLTVLGGGAAWLLALHWLDLYWLIMPEASPDRLGFHVLDLTCLVAVGGTWCAFVFFVLSRRALVPVGDPRLEESLRFESA